MDEAFNLGIIEGKAWKTYNANNGESIKYQSNYSEIIKKGLIDEIIDKIYEKRRFVYKDPNNTEQITETSEVNEDGELIKMTVKKGDKVLVTKYGPSEVKVGDVEYLI